ncbi:MAG: hypothetical protein RLZZ546_567 [Bacteroidota bacterium]|jgi:hypothetical protein
MKINPLLILVFLKIVVFTEAKGQLHYRFKDLPCLNKTFNIDVHIVMDSLRTKSFSRQDIINGFSDANNKFSEICVNFVPCKIDTIYDYAFDSIWTNQEYELLSTLYSSPNKINLFIITDIALNFNNRPQAICGLGGKTVYIGNGCFGSLAHEFGHTFGLAHTFLGSGEELVDGSNCETAGDGICDTPADPYEIFEPLGKYIKNCEFISEKKDKNNMYYTPHVANIMSYYDCPCSHFSRGQFLKMVDVINTIYKFYY